MITILCVGTILNILSAFLALVAAAFWLASATVVLPKAIESIDGGSFDQTTPKPDDDLDRLTKGLRKQSKLSANGAIAAALAAFFQGVATVLPLV